MESRSVKIEVNARALPQAPLLGFLSTLVVSLSREFEEFIVDESDGSVTSTGSYPDSSFRDPLIFLSLENFEPNYVFNHLCNQFHDRVLSQIVSDEIVIENQRSQREQPLFMIVSVKLTQKVFMVVSGNSASSTKDLGESETCAICLENLSESGSEEAKPICELPNCAHLFHEECFIEWLDRHNSCPLCRKAVYEEPDLS